MNHLAPDEELSSPNARDLDDNAVAHAGRFRRSRAMRIYPAPTLIEVLLGILWLAAVLLGTVLLSAYKSAPGVAYSAPVSWPASSHLPRPERAPVLLMFAHPRCACSVASVGELATIMSAARGAVDARVLFDQPAGASDDWSTSDLWRKAAAVPGVAVAVDRGGEEANRFGASTSGHVVLYARDGRLLFAGGITSARGHAGDSAGRRAILSLLERGAASRSRAPVFGCSLEGDEGRSAWTTSR